MTPFIILTRKSDLPISVDGDVKPQIKQTMTFQREGSPYLACSDRNAFFTSEKP